MSDFIKNINNFIQTVEKMTTIQWILVFIIVIIWKTPDLIKAIAEIRKTESQDKEA